MKSRRLQNAAALLALAVMVGCSGDDGAPGAPGADAHGKVAILIADDPADDYDSILLKIREVTLMPGRVELFRDDDGVEVDLLDLRDEDYLLRLATDVPAGTYDKIILEIADIRTVGGPCDDKRVKIPSGRVQLNPRGSFEVRAGRTLAIRLDVDAHKSIGLHQAGRSGKCIFRPVVFVDIEEGAPMMRCPRAVAGTIGSIRETDGERSGFELQLGGSRGDLDVVFSGTLRVFDADGFAADASALARGQRVRVRGRLDEEGRFVASVIVVGDVLVVSGVVATDIDDGVFVLDPAPSSAIVDPVNVSVAPQTLVLVDCDQEVASEAIREGMRAHVIGKLSLEEGVLRAAAVVLRPRVADASLVTFSAADGGGLDLVVRYGDAEDTSDVHLPEGSEIRLEGDGPVPLDVLERLLGCAERPIRLLLDPDDAGIATRVRVISDDVEGVVDSVDVDAARVTIDGRTLAVLDAATLLDIRDEQQPFELEDLVGGETLRVFGLSACDDDDVAGYAFVLLRVSADDEAEDASE